MRRAGVMGAAWAALQGGAVPVTWNPGDIHVQAVLTNSNLTVGSTTTFARGARATKFVSTGKWYAEFVLGGDVAVNSTFCGISTSASPLDQSGFNASASAAGAHYDRYGDVNIDGVTESPTRVTCALGDIIGMCVDHTNEKIYFSKNGVWRESANPSENTGGYDLPEGVYAARGSGSGAGGETPIGMTVTLRSTADAFTYPVPTGAVPYAEV